MPLPILEVFADLPDPRRETDNKLHRLGDILTLAVCSVIGGAETWDTIAEYGRGLYEILCQGTGKGISPNLRP